MSEIRLLVFNNGMQLLGEFLKADTETNKLVLKSPVQIVLVPKNQNQPQGQGEVGMAFAPFMQYTEEWDKGIGFSAVDVLTVLTPARELVNHYNVQFGSNLVLPPGLGK